MGSSPTGRTEKVPEIFQAPLFWYVVNAAGLSYDLITNFNAESAMRSATKRMIGLVVVAAFATAAHAEVIGHVNSAWNLFKDHTIQVEAFDDPLVQGVTCYVSRAVRGGIAGALGIATNTSDASIACRQVGPIKVVSPLPKQADAFSQRSSWLFKRLHVVRMVDVKRHVLVYLTYSDKLVDGSPKNAVTAVAVPASTPLPVQR